MNGEPLVASHFVAAGPPDDQLGAFREHEPLLIRVLRGRHDVPHLDSEWPELSPEHLLRRRRKPLAVAAIHLRPRALLERVRRRREGSRAGAGAGSEHLAVAAAAGVAGGAGSAGSAAAARRIDATCAEVSRGARGAGAASAPAAVAVDVFRLVFSLARHALELRQVAHLGPLAAGIARARRVHGDGVGGADDEEHALIGGVFFSFTSKTGDHATCRAATSGRAGRCSMPRIASASVCRRWFSMPAAEGGVLRAAARGGVVCQAHEPGVAVDEICGI